MEGQITIAQWQDWKEDMHRVLRETKELGEKICSNFVYIGYNLKRAEETEAYRMDGFADLNEFARSEYGLGASEVSRYKQINDRYSIGGNSLELKEEMQGFGLSQLVAMLSLPNEQHSLITPETTVREIRELTRFNKGKFPEMEEEVKRELEKGENREEIPAAGASIPRELTHLQECILDFFSRPAEAGQLQQIMEHIFQGGPGDESAAKKICEVMNPSGSRTHWKGLVYLFLYSYDHGVAYKLFTSPKPVNMSWTEFAREIQEVYSPYLRENGAPPANIWKAVYQKADAPRERRPLQAIQMELEDVGEIAASQFKEDAEKPSGPEEDIREKDQDLESAQEEQLPGQMSVSDYPGVVPEKTFQAPDPQYPEEGTFLAENVEEIREETGNRGGENDGENNDDRESIRENGGAGPAAGVGRTAEDPGEPDEGAGASEGGGCKTDIESLTQLWRQIRESHEDTGRFIRYNYAQMPFEISRKELEAAYRDALAAAAGIEKLLIYKQKYD